MSIIERNITQKNSSLKCSHQAEFMSKLFPPGRGVLLLLLNISNIYTIIKEDDHMQYLKTKQSSTRSVKRNITK